MRRMMAKSTASSSRNKPQPRWRRPLIIYGGIAFGCALIAGVMIWTWTSGRAMAAYDTALTALIDLSADAGLVTSEVFVAGRGQTSRLALIDALDVTLGKPILAYDTDAARRRVEALGWVREAVIERRLPDTIFLRIVERRPLALWQRSGRLVVVDLQGEVIKGAAPARFSRLPVIVGDDAPRHAGALLAVLAAEPSLSRRVAAAVRVGGRRWNLRFDNGVDVEMPEQDLAGAWLRLAKFERLHQLLARDITAIDLRLPDRLVVRPAEAFKGWRAGGENT